MSEQFVHEIIASLPDSDDAVALDIGTAEGMYAELLMPKFKTIYAFDPNPELHTIDNVENVYFVNKAIWNVTGKINFYLSSLNRGRNTINVDHVLRNINHVLTNPNEDWGYNLNRYMEVECITIDEFCQNMKIGFIKCDIEGGEEYIFQGGIETLRRNKMDVIIEFHDGVDPCVIRDFFTGLGYHIFKEPKIPDDKMYHYLFSNREERL